MSAPKSRGTIFRFAVDENVVCGRRGQTFIICTSSTIAGGPSRAKFGSEHAYASGSFDQTSIKTRRENDNVRYGPVDKSSVDAAVWKEAVAREAVIRALASSDRPSRAEVLRACRQLGLKHARLYQLLKAYRSRPVASSLLVRPAGTPRGARRLPIETEAVIAEALAKFYETLQKTSVNRLHQEVRRLCRARGLEAPGWHTLRARIDAIDPAELTRAQDGAEAARDRFQPVPGEYVAERAYARAAIPRQ